MQCNELYMWNFCFKWLIHRSNLMFPGLILSKRFFAQRNYHWLISSGSQNQQRFFDEICALLGYYAAWSGNPLPMFRDNVSVPSSRGKKSKKKIIFLNVVNGINFIIQASCSLLQIKTKFLMHYLYQLCPLKC
jgi:hypothetical protein